jgi:hypothetical protein
VINRPEISPAIVAKLASICLALPEAQQEPAWVGTRWCIRKKNFAHVVGIDAGWPPAYAQAAGAPGPMTVLTFRVPVSRLDTPRFDRPPFFRPVWFPNIVGVTLADEVDWGDIADLVAGSYCLLAPKKLASLVAGRGR